MSRNAASTSDFARLLAANARARARLYFLLESQSKDWRLACRARFEHECRGHRHRRAQAFAQRRFGFYRTRAQKQKNNKKYAVDSQPPPIAATAAARRRQRRCARVSGRSRARSALLAVACSDGAIFVGAPSSSPLSASVSLGERSASSPLFQADN